MPAHFDVHRLTERTTLIVVAGEISFAEAKSLIAILAEPLALNDSVILSLAQCKTIDSGAVRVCERIGSFLTVGQRFVVVLDDRNPAYGRFACDAVASRVPLAPTISAAVRYLERADDEAQTGTSLLLE